MVTLLIRLLECYQNVTSGNSADNGYVIDSMGVGVFLMVTRPLYTHTHIKM